MPDKRSDKTKGTRNGRPRQIESTQGGHSSLIGANTSITNQSSAAVHVLVSFI